MCVLVDARASLRWYLACSAMIAHGLVGILSDCMCKTIILSWPESVYLVCNTLQPSLFWYVTALLGSKTF